MTVYAVGDLQGCLEPLLCLLDEVAFNPSRDTLWCTGDLVNRGPASLETLRFIHGLGNACVTVLGNHDLHLLAIAYGQAKCKRSDTLDEILAAPDRDKLLEWLRHQPLVHYENGYTLVHAGIAPQWSLDEAISLAGEVHNILQGDEPESFFAHMYGNTPARWDDKLEGFDRLRLITNYFTRMRFCSRKGKLDLDNKQGPETAGKNCYPWFEVPGRAMAGQKIIFGHWAALEGRALCPDVYPLDTGCVWGGKMTLMRLGDEKLFSCHC